MKTGNLKTFMITVYIYTSCSTRPPDENLEPLWDENLEPLWDGNLEPLWDGNVENISESFSKWEGS